MSLLMTFWPSLRVSARTVNAPPTTTRRPLLRLSRAFSARLLNTVTRVVGGRAVGATAVVGADAIGGGQVQVGEGFPGVLPEAASGVLGQVAFGDDEAGHDVLLVVGWMADAGGLLSTILRTYVRRLLI